MSFMNIMARDNMRVRDKGTGPEMTLAEWLEQNRGAAGGQGLFNMSQSSQRQTQKKTQTGGGPSSKAKSASTTGLARYVLAKRSRLGG
jgi:hypothetical protein